MENIAAKRRAVAPAFSLMTIKQIERAAKLFPRYGGGNYLRRLARELRKVTNSAILKEADTNGRRTKVSVTVEYGINSHTSDLAGQKVCEIRGALRQLLNIDPAARIMVNGDAQTEHYVVQDGDVIEFVKASGQKGLPR